MVATRIQAAQDPLALFHALLQGNASLAQRLLAGSGAGQLVLVALWGNFTVLHAAAIGRSAAAIPQLAAACTAAGISVDAQLEMAGESLRDAPQQSPVWQQLRSLGCKSRASLREVEHRATALSIAVSKQDPAAINMLLQAGARPADSPLLGGVVCRILGCWSLPRRVSLEQLLNPLLQHGLDPLGPTRPTLQPHGQQAGRSLLVSCRPELCSLMLAHLDSQRAAGTLQLGSTHRCIELLLGASDSSNPPQQLVQHAATQLQQLTGIEAAGCQDAAELDRVLLAAAADGDPAVLSALLASQLPWNVAAMLPNSTSLVSLAAASPEPAACVRLLSRAGALPTSLDLYCAIDRLSPSSVAALLACGKPLINTSQPSAIAPCTDSDFMTAGWSCPIHRTLHALTAKAGDMDCLYKPALQILEALRAAGYRPAVYHNASLPYFTLPNDDSCLLPQLDPFDFYSLATSGDRGLPVARRYLVNVTGGLADWVLFAARDGSWSPATHRYWPGAFKAATRALLLAANRGCGSAGTPASKYPHTARRPRRQAATALGGGQQAGCTLGALPAELLLRIVKAAAEPLSGWL